MGEVWAAISSLMRLSGTRRRSPFYGGYYSSSRVHEAQYFSHRCGKSNLELAKKHVPLTGRRVLDFGCAPGFMIGHLLAEPIACAGLEFSAESIDAVGKKFGDHPLFQGAIEAKQLPVPFNDGSVDVVFLLKVIEHPLSEQFLRTLHDILRIMCRDGYIVTTLPNDGNLDASKVVCPECGCIFHRWEHQRSMNTESLVSSMESAGFRIIVCLATNFGPRSPLDPSRRVYRLLKGGTFSPHLVYIGQRE